MCPASHGLRRLAKFVFKVTAFRLDTRARTGAPLSDCVSITRWSSSQWRHVDRDFTRTAVKAVRMVDNSGSTSRSVISCLGPEIFVQINRILTKFCPWKLGVPEIMTHRVVIWRQTPGVVVVKRAACIEYDWQMNGDASGKLNDRSRTCSSTQSV